MRIQDASLKNQSLKIVWRQFWRVENKQNYFCTATSARNEREQWLPVLLFLTRRIPSGGKILLCFCVIEKECMAPWSSSPCSAQAHPSLGVSMCGPANRFCRASLITSDFSSVLREVLRSGRKHCNKMHSAFWRIQFRLPPAHLNCLMNSTQSLANGFTCETDYWMQEGLFLISLFLLTYSLLTFHLI